MIDGGAYVHREYGEHADDMCTCTHTRTHTYLCRVAVVDVPTERSPEALAFAMEDLASCGADGTIMAWYTADVITEDHVVNQFNLQQRYPDVFGVPAQAQTHPRCGSCRSRQVEEKLVGRLYITMLLERSAWAYVYIHVYVYIYID